MVGWPLFNIVGLWVDIVRYMHLLTPRAVLLKSTGGETCWQRRGKSIHSQSALSIIDSDIGSAGTISPIQGIPNSEIKPPQSEPL